MYASKFVFLHSWTTCFRLPKAQPRHTCAHRDVRLHTHACFTASRSRVASSHVAQNVGIGSPPSNLLQHGRRWYRRDMAAGKPRARAARENDLDQLLQEREHAHDADPRPPASSSSSPARECGSVHATVIRARQVLQESASRCWRSECPTFASSSLGHDLVRRSLLGHRRGWIRGSCREEAESPERGGGRPEFLQIGAQGEPERAGPEHMWAVSTRCQAVVRPNLCYF